MRARRLAAGRETAGERAGAGLPRGGTLWPRLGVPRPAGARCAAFPEGRRPAPEDRDLRALHGRLERPAHRRALSRHGALRLRARRRPRRAFAHRRARLFRRAVERSGRQPRRRRHAVLRLAAADEQPCARTQGSGVHLPRGAAAHRHPDQSPRCAARLPGGDQHPRPAARGGSEPRLDAPGDDQLRAEGRRAARLPGRHLPAGSPDPRGAAAAAPAARGSRRAARALRPDVARLPRPPARARTALRRHHVILVRNAEVVVTMDGARREIRGGSVLVRGDQIAAVGTDLEPIEGGPLRVIDARGCVVVPGLINGHHHMFQSLTRAIATGKGLVLFDWLKLLYTAWRHLDAEAAYVSAKLALSELLLSGATTVADHLYLYPNGVKLEDTIRAAQDLGVGFHPPRGAITLGQSEVSFVPDDLVERDDAVLADCLRLLQELHDASPRSML